MRIKNKSWSPMVISLPGGKSMTLAARSIGEISAEDFQNAEVQRLARARSIIVLPEEKKKSADTESKSSKPEVSPPKDGQEDETQEAKL